jgi:hypothetical protein
LINRRFLRHDTVLSYRKSMTLAARALADVRAVQAPCARRECVDRNADRLVAITVACARRPVGSVPAEWNQPGPTACQAIRIPRLSPVYRAGFRLPDPLHADPTGAEVARRSEGQVRRDGITPVPVRGCQWGPAATLAPILFT